jgi:RHS repeat-associated protein
MTTTKQHDFLNRLLSISSSASASSSSSISFSYQLNDANQRIAVHLADGSYWVNGYDNLGQLTSAKKYWPDGSPVAGQQFEYNFDDIGNRTSTKAGGDNVGQSLRPATYSANALNQYTSRDIPAAIDIIGVALAGSSVLVNNNAPYRHIEYFCYPLYVNNSSAAQWQSVTVSASGQSPSTTGHVFVPKNQEQFTYDDDGNLLSDGRWNYTWDAENRLLKMAARNSVGPTNSLQFEYDWKSRRIRKRVFSDTTWSNSTNDVRFVYDNWNLVAILNSQSSILQSFVWGLDLSGTAQGAGGVGGLLAVADSTQGTHFTAFDGNGNVAELVKASDGSTPAVYEYSPFGEPLRATGPMAKANPLRFSTKFQDDESDLLYYGYRYYNAGTGRWLGRDRLEEDGGANLFNFVGNDPVQQIDARGLCCCCCAENIRVADEKIQNILYFGHKIMSDVTLNYKPSDKSEDCTLQWFERADVPYDSSLNANQWYDMTKVPRAILSFKWWNKKDKKCPGLVPLHDDDVAQYWKNAKVSRKLEFFVIVSSAPSCLSLCKKPYVGFLAVQTLDPTQDPWVWDFKVILRF